MISFFYKKIQKPRSQTLHMIPDLGKQGLRPCFGDFCHVSFFTILISSDMSNALIMHTKKILKNLNPYFMMFSFFTILKKSRSQTLDQMSQTLHQYLVFRTVIVLVITHNGETCNDKLIQHFNIVIIIRCTIYDSMFIASSLLTCPALQSKVCLLGSFHSFLVFPRNFESLHANQNNASEWYFRKHLFFVWNPLCEKNWSGTFHNPQIV